MHVSPSPTCPAVIFPPFASSKAVACHPRSARPPRARVIHTRVMIDASAGRRHRRTPRGTRRRWNLQRRRPCTSQLVRIRRFHGATALAEGTWSRPSPCIQMGTHCTRDRRRCSSNRLVGHIRRYSWRTRRCHHTSCRRRCIPRGKRRKCGRNGVGARDQRRAPAVDERRIRALVHVFATRTRDGSVAVRIRRARAADHGGSRDGSGVPSVEDGIRVVIQALIVLVGDELIGGSRFEIIDLVDVPFDVGLSERL